jgi:hypothetical protein
MSHPAGEEKTMNNVLSVRIDTKTLQMLEEIEAKAAAQDDMMGPIPVKRADIITRCIREYYAKVIDSSASDAYMDLIETTLRAIVEPYFNAQTAATKRLLNIDRKTLEEVRLAAVKDRMSFGIQFEAYKITTDKETLRSLFTASKPYDVVLDEVAAKRLAGEETKQEEDKTKDNEEQEDYFKSNKSGLLGGNTWPKQRKLG